VFHDPILIGIISNRFVLL